MNYGHDPYTYKNSHSKVSRMKRKWKQMDGQTNCYKMLTLPANTVSKYVTNIY